MKVASAFVDDYHHAVIQVVCMLHKQHYYPIFATAELFPTELPMPPQEEIVSVRAAYMPGKPRIFHRRYTVSTAEALAWYEACRDGQFRLCADDADKRGLLGDNPVRLQAFADAVSSAPDVVSDMVMAAMNALVERVTIGPEKFVMMWSMRYALPTMQERWDGNTDFGEIWNQNTWLHLDMFADGLAVLGTLLKYWPATYFPLVERLNFETVFQAILTCLVRSEIMIDQIYHAPIIPGGKLSWREGRITFEQGRVAVPQLILATMIAQARVEAGHQIVLPPLRMALRDLLGCAAETFSVYDDKQRWQHFIFAKLYLVEANPIRAWSTDFDSFAQTRRARRHDYPENDYVLDAPSLYLSWVGIALIDCCLAGQSKSEAL